MCLDLPKRPTIWNGGSTYVLILHFDMEEVTYKLVILFCRTSTDLFKTVFDLMISVTLFVGRFDMRMMQVHQFFASLLCLFSLVSSCASFPDRHIIIVI